ncbi:MAG: ribosome silencing factor [Tannerella sp.]|jgi:ribosome-associated protein|nr:ribosome silencing factor [Tannerella sp.]
MDETKKLMEAIVKGLREKKGKEIVAVDMTLLSGAICQYMIICEGNSFTQLSSLSDSVWDIVRKDTGDKPLSIHGNRNSPWIGMDYGTILVHIFLPEYRSFYNLEHLWADTNITTIPDLD